MCDQRFAGHIVGVGGTTIDSASCCGEKSGEKRLGFCNNAGVGLGGGNGTSKVGAESRRGGSGEEYDAQVGGQVGRIKEGDRKGWKGADSSEEVGGMVGIAGRRIEGDGIGNCGKGRVHRRSSEEWWEL